MQGQGGVMTNGPHFEPGAAAKAGRKSDSLAAATALGQNPAGATNGTTPTAQDALPVLWPFRVMHGTASH